MPEISRFDGLVVRMYFSDVGQHNKPHIHVYFGEFEAVVGLDGELLAGSLPHKKLTVVQAWIIMREQELYVAWNDAVRNKPIGKIKPIS